MIRPVFTEKSMRLAKDGQYSFWVSLGLTKGRIKAEIKKLFGVNVSAIRTIKVSGEAKRNNKGKKVTILPRKKAIVVLKKGEKMDIFEDVTAKTDKK